MTIRRPPSKALSLLAQFAPREVLERARDLARQFERDEYVTNYIARRSLFVAVAAIAVALTFFLATVFLLTKWPVAVALLAGWEKVAVLTLGGLFWAGGTITVMYFILSSLQRAALAERVKEENQSIK